VAVVAALVLALASLAGCTSTLITAPDQARSGALPGLATPPVIPYAPGRINLDPAQLAPCHAGGDVRDGGELPDPHCTPGAVGETKVDLVCNPKFQAAHRVDTTKARLIAMQAYGVRIEDSGVTEYDHRIPLSIGGANATPNLWPQRSDIANARPLYRNTKDAIEYTVWYAVCRAHTVPLAQAQKAFMGDWRRVLQALQLRPMKVPAGVAQD
jgi:hypothetical protein